MCNEKKLSNQIQSLNRFPIPSFPNQNCQEIRQDSGENLLPFPFRLNTAFSIEAENLPYIMNMLQFSNHSISMMKRNFHKCTGDSISCELSAATIMLTFVDHD